MRVIHKESFHGVMYRYRDLTEMSRIPQRLEKVRFVEVILRWCNFRTVSIPIELETMTVSLLLERSCSVITIRRIVIGGNSFPNQSRGSVDSSAHTPIEISFKMLSDTPLGLGQTG